MAGIRETAAAALAELEAYVITLSALDPSPGVRALGAELQAAAAQLVPTAEQLAEAAVASRTSSRHDWRCGRLLPGHGGRRRFGPGEWAPQLYGMFSYWGASGVPVPGTAPTADRR